MTKLGKNDRVHVTGDHEVTDVNDTPSGQQYTVSVTDANGKTHELVMKREDLYFPEEDEVPTATMG